jgi:hypothetical protein
MRLVANCESVVVKLRAVNRSTKLNSLYNVLLKKTNSNRIVYTLMKRIFAVERLSSVGCNGCKLRKANARAVKETLNVYIDCCVSPLSAEHVWQVLSFYLFHLTLTTACRFLELSLWVSSVLRVKVADVKYKLLTVCTNFASFSQRNIGCITITLIAA